MKISREEVTSGLIDEIMVLGINHSEEIGEGAYGDPNVNHDVMIKLAEMGLLQVVTARHESEIVGYLIFMISQDFLYQHVTVANEAGLYVLPDSRGAVVAKALVAGAELEALKLGADRFTLHTTIHNDVGKLFERFGYRLAEKKYIKEMGVHNA